MSASRYQFHVTHIDADCTLRRAQRFGRMHWPSAPREGDLVSLGGGDKLVTDVNGVEFRDGWVRLNFLVRDDADEQITWQEVLDLGYEQVGPALSLLTATTLEVLTADPAEPGQTTSET